MQLLVAREALRIAKELSQRKDSELGTTTGLPSEKKVNAAVEQLEKVLQLADAAGARIKLVEVAGGDLKRVKNMMGNRGDVAAGCGAVREEAGLGFRN